MKALSGSPAYFKKASFTFLLALLKLYSEIQFNLSKANVTVESSAGIFDLSSPRIAQPREK